MVVGPSRPPRKRGPRPRYGGNFLGVHSEELWVDQRTAKRLAVDAEVYEVSGGQVGLARPCALALALLTALASRCPPLRAISLGVRVHRGLVLPRDVVVLSAAGVGRRFLDLGQLGFLVSHFRLSNYQGGDPPCPTGNKARRVGPVPATRPFGALPLGAAGTGVIGGEGVAPGDGSGPERHPPDSPFGRRVGMCSPTAMEWEGTSRSHPLT